MARSPRQDRKPGTPRKPWRTDAHGQSEPRLAVAQPSSVDALIPLDAVTEAQDRAKSHLRAEASVLALALTRGEVGMIDGVRQLQDILVRMGEFPAGEFSGDFAALSYFAFET